LRWKEVIERGEEAGAEEAVSVSEAEAVAGGALPIRRCRGVRGEPTRLLSTRAVAPRINPAHHEPKPRADPAPRPTRLALVLGCPRTVGQAPATTRVHPESDTGDVTVYPTSFRGQQLMDGRPRLPARFQSSRQ
jgi:hypothetical protein